MKKLYIGIDISKDKFDYCAMNQDRKVLTKGVLDNTKDGILELISIVKGYNEYDSWICMEHTGHYGALLTTILDENKMIFSVVNPLEIKKSMGIVRGKSDSVDAYRIATYALSNNFKLEVFNLPSEDLKKLKAIMSVREGYVKIKVQLKNSLKALLILGKTTDVKELIKEQKLLINRQEKAIAKTDKQIKIVIEGNSKLKKTFDKITSVIGVGPITAVSCIIETENFTKFTNGRKFCCHCGLAPFAHQYGSRVRGKTRTSPTRTSPACNKRLKALLLTAATTAGQHDPQLKQYQKRKLKEGKNIFSVKNAVANKIILRIFAVVKRDKPYVKLAA